jgi:hypothetical protein
VRPTRFGDQARALPARLGKSNVDIVFECGALRFPRGDTLAPFWSAFVHVVRNAVDHGLDSTEQRQARGYADSPALTFAARIIDNELSIEIADNGRGIAWEAAGKARRPGRDRQATRGPDALARITAQYASDGTVGLAFGRPSRARVVVPVTRLHRRHRGEGLQRESGRQLGTIEWRRGSLWGSNERIEYRNLCVRNVQAFGRLVAPA